MWMSHSLIFFAHLFCFGRLNQLYLNAWEQCRPCILAKRLDLMAPHHTRFLSALSCFLFRALSSPTVSLYFLSLPMLPSPPSFLPSVCLPLFFSHPLSVVGSLPGTMHIPSWKIWSFVQTPASKICPEKSLMAVSTLQTSPFAFPSLLFGSFSHIWACWMPPLLAAFLFNVYFILHH